MWEEKNCCTPQKFLGREGMWPGCTPHKKESKESENLFNVTVVLLFDHHGTLIVSVGQNRPLR